MEEELWQQKDRGDQLRAQANRCLKEKTEYFEKLYRQHKELEKEYYRQRDKLKEARTEVTGNTEALAMQEMVLAETTTKLLEDTAKERMELLLEHNQVVERSKVVLDNKRPTKLKQ